MMMSFTCYYAWVRGAVIILYSNMKLAVTVLYKIAFQPYNYSVDDVMNNYFLCV